MPTKVEMIDQDFESFLEENDHTNVDWENFSKLVLDYTKSDRFDSHFDEGESRQIAIIKWTTNSQSLKNYAMKLLSELSSDDRNSY